MTYKELFPTRIPEAVQGDNNLKEYLETAGEIVDEFVKAIDGFENYRDYEYVAEKRLRKLAKDFAMEFPRNLDEETQRRIIRDMGEIYSRVGVLEVINWTFRLIGWEVSMEYAWLPNPDRYDPLIADEKAIDSYSFLPGFTKTPTEIVDFFRTDYRSFLIGEEYVTPEGVYFKGREFFDTEQTIDQLEIVGEYYKTESKIRTSDKVAKTPYVFVRVSDDTYNRFLSPYVDEETGEIYSYSELEIFKVVQNILNYFVFDQYRPTHIRVVIIVTTQQINDSTYVEDFFESEYIPKPLLMEDEGVITTQDFSRLDHVIRSGNFFMAGTPPSPFGRKMVLAPLKSTKFTTLSDPYERYKTTGGDSRYRIERPLEKQPEPYCRTNEFTFYTPDLDYYEFRRVYFNEDAFLSAHYERGTGGSVDSGTYPDDLGSLRLNVDLIDDTYGIVEALAVEAIIIREPTEVRSPNFYPNNTPTNEYKLGMTTDMGETFTPDTLISFDLKNKNLQTDDAGEKTFTYHYDMDVMVKESVQTPSWQVLLTNPTTDSLVTLYDWNEILFVPTYPLGFDFVIDVKYLAQPNWDNDPREYRNT